MHERRSGQEPVAEGGEPRASGRPGERQSERRTGPPELRAAAAAVPSRSARRALRQFLNARRDGWVLDGRLEAAARMVGRDARRCALPPERMLVLLKRAWWALDESRQLPPLEAEDALCGLVSLSIRAYYDWHPDDENPWPADDPERA